MISLLLTPIKSKHDFSFSRKDCLTVLPDLSVREFYYTLTSRAALFTALASEYPHRQQTAVKGLPTFQKRYSAGFTEKGLLK